MGLILDSSLVITGERKRLTVQELLAQLRTTVGLEDIALSVISVVELEHGIWRARDGTQAESRRRFFEELSLLFRCNL